MTNRRTTPTAERYGTERDVADIGGIPLRMVDA
jgi:hypothetical protein